jgi:ATP-dependent helicase HrpA
MDVLLKAVRDKTQLDVKRNDFKLDTLSPHLFMNYRVVDEHGRQLGMGRNLAVLKAELGSLARGAFQALAALKAQAVAQGGANSGASVEGGATAQAGVGSSAAPGHAGGRGATPSGGAQRVSSNAQGGAGKGGSAPGTAAGKPQASCRPSPTGPLASCPS